MLMAELQERYRQARTLVVDVRSPAEYRRGHVPGAENIPLSEVRRTPERFRLQLAPYREVFIYCSSGKRSGRAYRALRQVGLANVVHIDRSGMPQWVRQHLPVERSISASRDLITGVAAGLAGQLAAALTDKALRPLVADEQKRRERRVREGSPHEVGGKRIAAKVLGRRLSGDEQEEAQAAFSIAYGVLWGLVYALVRRRLPRSSALLGLPFAIAFFAACDGVLAPLFRMTPGLRRIPWQFNAKEMMNHVAWTVAAESVHRGAERYPSR
jgi:putative membrane protein